MPDTGQTLADTPFFSGAANLTRGDKLLGTRGQAIGGVQADGPLFLPAVNSTDNGKLLEVRNGVWQAGLESTRTDTVEPIYTTQQQFRHDSNTRTHALLSGKRFSTYDDIAVEYYYIQDINEGQRRFVASIPRVLFTSNPGASTLHADSITLSVRFAPTTQNGDTNFQSSVQVIWPVSIVPESAYSTLFLTRMVGIIRRSR